MPTGEGFKKKSIFLLLSSVQGGLACDKVTLYENFAVTTEEADVPIRETILRNKSN